VFLRTAVEFKTEEIFIFKKGFNMTIKLYDDQPYMSSFKTKAVSCVKEGDRYAVVFESTAFFPEGGGQPSDTGFADGIRVTDVQEKHGIIVHYLENELCTGKEIDCTIDWKKRFSNMQNHSGEHIVSGLINKRFGYNNVGFHLGSDGVTVDVDGVLTENDIAEIEYSANAAVFENVRIIAEYPDEDTLKNINYRSKLDLTENVRIVTIEGYDVCACCAPHVMRTGEIGLIKITGSEKYKGGTRLHMICGFRALEDYRTKQKNIYEISVLLSAKQENSSEAVKRLCGELSEEKRKLSELRRELVSIKAESIPEADGNICIFEESCSMNDLRNIVNICIKKCGGICAAFSGNDKNGYQYIIAAENIDLKSRAAELNENISGKGGGSSAMIQGSSSGCREDIKKYIDNFK